MKSAQTAVKMTRRKTGNRKANRRFRRPARPKVPTLRFSPYAWAKLLYLRDRGDSEVGGFGIQVVLIEPGPVRTHFGRTGIDSLDRSDGDPAYSALRESIRSGLTSTFEGPGSERSSTPEEVAAVCVEAMEASHPRPRYVVGAMAEALIEQHREEGDEAWDRFLAGLYARPGPASSG